MDSAMVNLKVPGIHLIIKVGNKVYVQNQGLAKCTLRRGTVLCSFGKGSFKVKTEAEESSPGHVLYHLIGHQDEALWFRVLSLGLTCC